MRNFQELDPIHGEFIIGGLGDLSRQHEQFYLLNLSMTRAESVVGVLMPAKQRKML